MRLTPRRLSREGRRPVTSRPLTRTLPRSGTSWPRMQLNSVDLPEPLGPITPRISPSRTSKETPRRACTPPNDFSMSRTSSSAVSERAFPASRRVARPTIPPGKKAIMTITSTA